MTQFAELEGTRPPAVGGLFYPDDPETLRTTVQDLLDEARSRESVGPDAPKALIVPHAGYRYSGPVAASGYVHLLPGRETIRRVVLLGPAHRYGFQGLAVARAAKFATPLGTVDVDAQAVSQILELPLVQQLDQAHAFEHSLEVHLPFLQVLLRDFQVVPIVVGQASARDVSRVLDALWGGAETCIVISSDLSHYHSDAQARVLDRETTEIIEAGRPELLRGDKACGYLPIAGLLHSAGRNGLALRNVDLRNSAQTAGGAERVVGYGAYVTEPARVRQQSASEEARADTAVFPSTVGMCGLGVESFQAPVKSDPRQEHPPGSASGQQLQLEHKQLLLRVAAESIHQELQIGRPPVLDPNDFPASMGSLGGAFVTLKKEGHLRGCVGTLSAHSPLVVCVAQHAGHAAFRDRRFPPLEAAELDGLEISVSILSAPVAMEIRSEEDLLERLRPGIDGLILQDGERSGVFLPAVWKELPSPGVFVRRLKQKAGWSPDYWSDTLVASRFTAESIEGRISTVT